MGTTFSTAAGKGDTREPSPTNDERSAKEDPSGLRSALRKAVEGGGLQEVQGILALASRFSRESLLLNAQDGKGQSIIHLAASSTQPGSRSIIRQLLDHGGDPNMNNTKQPHVGTPLHVAVAAKNLPVAEELLHGGANPFLCNAAGKMAYECAESALSTAAAAALMRRMEKRAPYAGRLRIKSKTGKLALGSSSHNHVWTPYHVVLVPRTYANAVIRALGDLTRPETPHGGATLFAISSSGFDPGTGSSTHSWGSAQQLLSSNSDLAGSAAAMVGAAMAPQVADKPGHSASQIDLGHTSAGGGFPAQGARPLHTQCAGWELWVFASPEDAHPLAKLQLDDARADMAPTLPGGLPPSPSPSNYPSTPEDGPQPHQEGDQAGPCLGLLLPKAQQHALHGNMLLLPVQQPAVTASGGGGGGGGSGAGGHHGGSCSGASSSGTTAAGTRPGPEKQLLIRPGDDTLAATQAFFMLLNKLLPEGHPSRRGSFNMRQGGPSMAALRTLSAAGRAALASSSGGAASPGAGGGAAGGTGSGQCSSPLHATPCVADASRLGPTPGTSAAGAGAGAGAAATASGSGAGAGASAAGLEAQAQAQAQSRRASLAEALRTQVGAEAAAAVAASAAATAAAAAATTAAAGGRGRGGQQAQGEPCEGQLVSEPAVRLHGPADQMGAIAAAMARAEEEEAARAGFAVGSGEHGSGHSSSSCRDVTGTGSSGSTGSSGNRMVHKLLLQPQQQQQPPQQQGTAGAEGSAPQSGPAYAGLLLQKHQLGGASPPDRNSGSTGTRGGGPGGDSGCYSSDTLGPLSSPVVRTQHGLQAVPCFQRASVGAPALQAPASTSWIPVPTHLTAPMPAVGTSWGVPPGPASAGGQQGAARVSSGGSGGPNSGTGAGGGAGAYGAAYPATASPPLPVVKQVGLTQTWGGTGRLGARARPLIVAISPQSSMGLGQSLAAGGVGSVPRSTFLAIPASPILSSGASPRGGRRSQARLEALHIPGPPLSPTQHAPRGTQLSSPFAVQAVQQGAAAAGASGAAAAGGATFPVQPQAPTSPHTPQVQAQPPPAQAQQQQQQQQQVGREQLWRAVVGAQPMRMALTRPAVPSARRAPGAGPSSSSHQRKKRGYALGAGGTTALSMPEEDEDDLYVDEEAGVAEAEEEEEEEGQMVVGRGCRGASRTSAPPAISAPGRGGGRKGAARPSGGGGGARGQGAGREGGLSSAGASSRSKASPASSHSASHNGASASAAGPSRASGTSGAAARAAMACSSGDGGLGRWVSGSNSLDDHPLLDSWGDVFPLPSPKDRAPQCERHNPHEHGGLAGAGAGAGAESGPGTVGSVDQEMVFGLSLGTSPAEPAHAWAGLGGGGGRRPGSAGGGGRAGAGAGVGALGGQPYSALEEDSSCSYSRGDTSQGGAALRTSTGLSSEDFGGAPATPPLALAHARTVGVGIIGSMLHRPTYTGAVGDASPPAANSTQLMLLPPAHGSSLAGCHRAHSCPDLEEGLVEGLLDDAELAMAEGYVAATTPTASDDAEPDAGAGAEPATATTAAATAAAGKRGWKGPGGAARERAGEAAEGAEGDARLSCHAAVDSGAVEHSSPDEFEGARGEGRGEGAQAGAAAAGSRGGSRSRHGSACASAQGSVVSKRGKSGRAKGGEQWREQQQQEEEEAAAASSSGAEQFAVEDLGEKGVGLRRQGEGGMGMGAAGSKSQRRPGVGDGGGARGVTDEEEGSASGSGIDGPRPAGASPAHGGASKLPRSKKAGGGGGLGGGKSCTAHGLRKVMHKSQSCVDLMDLTMLNDGQICVVCLSLLKPMPGGSAMDQCCLCAVCAEQLRQQQLALGLSPGGAIFKSLA